MKKTSIIFATITLFFAALTYYFMFYGDGGADGLSTFILIAFAGILCFCSLLAFLLTLFLRKGQSRRTRNWIMGVALVLPLLGFICVAGVFTYFTADYQSQWEIRVEKDKTVLNDKHFKDTSLGISFNYVSANVTSYINDMPVPTPITPKIKNGILLVPVDDESYHDPDVLLKLNIDPNTETSQFLKDLEKQLQLTKLNFNKISAKALPKLDSSYEIWSAQRSQTSPEDRKKLKLHFVPDAQFSADIAYFIRSKQKPSVLWLLIVSDRVLSVPSFVGNMSTSNFKDKNLWFHTLQLQK